MFTCQARLIRETSKAILVEVTYKELDPVGYGGPELEIERWLPKSKATLVDGVLTVPLWLARNEGLERGSLSSRYSRYGRVL